MNPSLRELLDEAAVVVTLPAGVWTIVPGPHPRMYVVVRGSLELLSPAATIGRGGCVPAIGLLTGAGDNATMRTRSTVELVALDMATIADVHYGGWGQAARKGR